MKMTTDGIGYAEKTGGITRIPVAQQYASTLGEGDIILASIERLEGETLKLRTDDGMLLEALLQGDLGLMQGDTVETIVGKNDGRCLLYILNVSHAGVSASENSPGQQGVSPGVLSDMLATLKQNPGMDADTAMFLAENHIPDTADNISALTQLARGEGIGTLLGQILDSVIKADELLPQSAPAAGETLQPEISESENPKSQDITNKQLSADAAVRMEMSSKETPAGVMPHMDSAALPGKNEGRAGIPSEPLPSADSLMENETRMENHTQPTNSAALLEKPAGQPEPALPQDMGMTMKEDVATPHYAQEVAMPDIQADAEAPTRRIVKTIRDITCQFDGCTGGEIKKIISDIPRTLSLLKSQLVRSDMKHEGNCIKTVDEALRQTELADRTIRFEHMQLPLANRTGEYQTAELYVFRDRNKRKNTAEAGIAILLALDTKHIGRTETLIREAGGDISLEFRVEQADTAEVFKKQTALLTQVVEATGYRLTAIRFTGLERRTTLVNAGQATGLDAGQAPKGIDVRI